MTRSSHTLGRRLPHLVRIVVLAVVAGLVLAGCSGSDSTETASMRSQARADAGADDPGEGTTPPAEGEDPGGSGGGGSTGSEGEGSGGSGGGSGDAAAFCDRVRGFSGPTNSDDIGEAIAFIEQLRDVAPSEIADDLDVMLDMVRRLEGLENVDENDPEALGEVFEALLDPAVIKASENVAKFAAEECGVDLEGEIDVSPPVGPGG